MTSRTRRYVAPILAFVAASLVGPLLMLLLGRMWSSFDEGDLHSIFFVHDITFLLWPGPLILGMLGMLSVVGIEWHESVLTVRGVGVNVVLFGLVGVLATTLTKRPRHVTFAYVGIAALLVTMDLLLSGGVSYFFQTPWPSWLALLIALGVYALPFYVLARSKT